MENQQAQLFLASSSPRRKELLKQIGIQFNLVEQHVDERHLSGETPREYVLRLSIEKAHAGLNTLPKTENKPVLGADTIVVVDKEILGKPRSQTDAERMLKLLSGCTHQVLTAVTLCTSTEAESVVVTTQVSFKQLTFPEIQDYWQSGEPLGKAGAYAIQGLGAAFVSKIEGSYSGVVGLPLFETLQLFQKFRVVS